jgi:Ca2+/Na+ antiporter
VAVAAAICRRPEIALGVIFSTSVASLSLAMGSIAMMAPLDAPAGPRKVWAFLMPAALITLLAGFKGRLLWYHALILLIEGVVIWLVWNDRSNNDNPQPASPMFHTPRRKLQALASIALCVLGAGAAVLGTMDVSAHVTLATGGVLSAAMLSPLLTLPMIGSGQVLVERGRAWEASASHVGVALLNLCLALPLVIVLWYTIVFTGLTGPALIPRVLSYPLGVWRVDSVVLVVIGMMLIPASLGKWVIGRSEGVALVLGYVIYVSLAIAANW